MEEKAERLLNPEVVNNYKERESTTYRRTDKYMNLGSLWQEVRVYEFMPDKNPSTEEREKEVDRQSTWNNNNNKYKNNCFQLIPTWKN